MAERMTSMGVVVRAPGGPEALEWTPLALGSFRFRTLGQRRMILRAAAID